MLKSNIISTFATTKVPNVSKPNYKEMKYVRTLTVITDAEIRQNEIPLFRGAVIDSLGEHPNVYFHNHLDNDKFRYAYPLIQYKRLGGKAAIVCIEDGVDIIGQFLTEVNGTLTIGERQITCNTGRIQPARILVQTWQTCLAIISADGCLLIQRTIKAIRILREWWKRSLFLRIF